MFPFIIKGKVPLGLRRDYHLSEAGLRERIEERLIQPARKSEVRTDGSFAGDARGLIAGGWSRLKSMGFLTAVRVRKIRIISRKDLLFAGYEMDATASTLVSMVIIPLVLGSILFSHSAFGFYEALALLLLMVFASWGLDVLVLVMMLRHEIRQIASEIRAIMRKHDTQKIELHHRNISPEELLTTAYYYERNGLVRRCEAYLAHLAVQYPDTLEAALALEHMATLDGIPARTVAVRTREGERKVPPPPVKKAYRFWSRKSRREVPVDSARGNGQNSKDKRRTWFGLPQFLRRKGKDRGALLRADNGSKKGSRSFNENRKRGIFRRKSRETFQERVLRKRRERLERRENFAKAPDEKNLPPGTRLKLRLKRLVHWESRQERQYRKEQERWLHGPRTRKLPPRMDKEGNNRSYQRPNWLRSRRERRAIEQQKRWLEGPPGPGSIQRSRDRWGRWLLQRREDKKGRLYPEDRSQAEGGPTP